MILNRVHTGNITVRLSGSSMLVTGLAEQAPRPKRIDTLTLPLASFGDPLIAGVRLIYAIYKRPVIMD